MTAKKRKLVEIRYIDYEGTPAVPVQIKFSKD